MGLTTVEVYSNRELFLRSGRLIDTACTCHRPAHIIVPTPSWVAARKKILAREGSAGVSVQTLGQWIEGAWGLLGDGRILVGDAQRQALIRPLAARSGLLGGKPSTGFVRMLSALAADASASDLDSLGSLSDSESKVIDVVLTYKQSLDKAGLIEQAQAALQLSYECFASDSFVFEAPMRSCVYGRRLIECLSEHADVVVLRKGLRVDCTASDRSSADSESSEACSPESVQSPEDLSHKRASQSDEIDALRRTLFTGMGGLKASGDIVSGISVGTHATPSLLARLLSRLMSQGASPGDIFVAFRDSTDAYPHVCQALARAGIPFEVSFTVGFAQTGLGGAFCDLTRFVEDPKADDGMELLLSFLSSPYSGIDPADARALQYRWRQCAGSCPDSWIRDIREGFSSAKVSASKAAERLLFAAQALDLDTEGRARLMLKHAAGAVRDATQIADDLAAFSVLLNHLQTITEIGATLDIDDVSELRVTLERSFAPEGCDADSAVMLAQASDVVFQERPYVVFADLDVDHYPMASSETPFDVLREKFGIGVPDDTANDQRILLLDLLEAADRGFAFYRSTLSADGNESCQSALWDEIVSCYRSAHEAEQGGDAAEIPAALAPYTIELSESEVFFEGLQAKDPTPDPTLAPTPDPTLAPTPEAPPYAPGSSRALPSILVRRGSLGQEASIALLAANADGTQREFSPTQLEDYYRCPYRWFTSRRVGYTVIDKCFDKSAQGTLFHDAMARFYPALKKSGHNRVTPENLIEARELADAVFDEQVADSARDPAKGVFITSKTDVLALQELKESYLAFIERDAWFLPGFEPTYFEVRLQSDKTALEYATVPVRGSVDRIDVDSQGNAVIIDYKLSGLSKGYGLQGGGRAGELNLHIQSDIYAVLAEKHFALQGRPLRVLGSVYRSYAVNRLRGVYESGLDFGPVESVQSSCDALPNKNMPIGYREYLERVEAHVTDCLRRLAAGDIAPAPIAKGVCLYCKASSFCPRKEG